MSDRPFDLVLFGATGFTGRLVAEVLARRGGVKWALAGRSEAKLRAVRSALPASAHDVPVLVADASVKASLDAVATQTRVVCTTVGPYAKYGLPLVAACAEAGTDCCDLTGEVPFVRQAIDGFHARAEQTGARIVNCCGFDSIPSDLGVLALHDHFRKRGHRLARAKFVMGKMKGGISGGTTASAVNMMAQARHDPELRRLMGDPYSLSPDRARDRGPDGGDQMGLVYDHELGQWTAPFVMAGINTRIVRRSNVLLDWAYGHDFRYSEVTGLPRGVRGAAMGAAMVAGLGTFMALATADLTRPLVERALPKPGEGPDEETRKRGFFHVDLYGTAAGDAEKAVCRIDGEGDPGYDATSRMLAEAALLLAETSSKKTRGGLLTPASALGLPLVDRLRKVGVRFEVHPAG